MTSCRRVIPIARKSEDERILQDAFDQIAQALEELAKVTGGEAFFPKTFEEVEELCRQIAHELRNHYTIGYNPSNRNLDGTWRNVEVRVNAPRGFPKLSVRTKPGYRAPDGKPTSQNR